jgi:hypothetical protein
MPFWLALLVVVVVGGWGWGLRRDWGLARRGFRGLREPRTMRCRPRVYHCAAAVDLLARAAWALSLSPPVRGGALIGQQLPGAGAGVAAGGGGGSGGWGSWGACLGLGLGLLEVARRCLWNALRLDHRAVQVGGNLPWWVYLPCSCSTTASVE